MADNVKSVSIKIGADISDFKKSLKSINSEINTTSKTANELQKGLQLDFDESRFTQAQKQVQAALSATETKAEAIRQELKYLEETGAVDTTGYKSLQTELAKTETKALQLKEQLEQIDKIKIDNLSKQFTDFGSKIEGVGNSLLGISTAAGAAAVGILAAGKSAAASGAEIDDMAQRTQISAERLQELSYIALQTGVEQDQLQKAIIKTRAVMADFALGTENTATKALQKLNIDISNFENSEEAFDGIIQALQGIDDLTLQAAVANEIFGDRLANNLIPYINAGDEAIQQFKSEFAEMSSLTDEEIAALAGLDDSFNRLTETLEYQKMQLGVALIPVWESLIELAEEKLIPIIEEVIDWFDGLSTEQQQTLLTVLALIAGLAPLLIIIGKVSQGIGALIQLLGNLKKTSLATMGGVMALVGALALGLDLIINWQDMSTVEKILKSLALAALTAAAAVAVFHSTWSVGLAVGAITAGIVAAIAAINAAKDKILPEEEDIDLENLDKNFNDDGYNFSSESGYGTGNSYSDNSTTQINITMNASGDLNYDANALADAVNKALVNKKLTYR